MSDQNPSRPQPALPYRAYLIRLWYESPTTGWRASAQSVQSGETVRFASLKALFAFLQNQTCDRDDQPPSL